MSVTEELDALALEHVEAADGIALEFQTKKFNLEALILKAVNAIPSRDLMPVLKNFLIVVVDGKLKVSATDVELSVVATSGAVSASVEGRAVFPAKKLQEIVRSAPEGEINICVEVKDNKASAKIETERTTWNIRLMPDEDYPDLPNADEYDFSDVSKTKFIAAIKQVRQAVTSDTMRGHLRMIDISDGRMRASDGVRFQQVTLDFPQDVQIPINAVDDLMKVLALSEADEFGISENEDSLLFKIGKDLFVAQKMNHEFPNVDETLLKPALENDFSLHVDRRDLINAIKRVRITADEETSAVLLHIDTDSITVTSKDKNGSTSSETVDATWEQNPRTVAFNHKHLLDMLNMAEVSSCEFRLGKEIKNRPGPLLLTDDASGMVGVLLQMRMSLLS